MWVRIDQLEAGDILEQDIMTRDFQILLGKGTILKNEYIEKLKELGVIEVVIRQRLKIPTQEIVILREDMEQSFRNKVREVMEKHTYQHNEELRELCQTADTIITEILVEDKVIEKVYDIRERNADIYEHSISVCTLVTLMALKYRLPKNKVREMGLACLLHDLGLRYLTINYVGRNMTEMSDTEFAEYKKHSVYAYSALKNESWISEESKNMILMHHEHMDGSGYPLHATMIPISIQIITLCDLFDEMICGIGYRRAKVHEAVEYLKAAANHFFPRELVNTFLNFIAIYPVGTKVRMNTGEVAVVVRQNHALSDRPIIRIIEDKSGQTVTDEIIKDLEQNLTLFIDSAEE